MSKPTKVLLPDSSYLTVPCPKDGTLSDLKSAIEAKMKKSGKPLFESVMFFPQIGLFGADLDIPVSEVLSRVKEDMFHIHLQEHDWRDDYMLLPKHRIPDIPSLRHLDPSGYLEKSGEKHKAFKKRWFVVKDYTVSYHGAPGEEAKGSFKIFPDTEILKNDSHGKAHCFDVRHKGEERVYVIAAASDDDEHTWREHLYKAALRNLKEYAARALPYLEKNALDVEGIFRLSAGGSVVTELKAYYEANGADNLSSVFEHDYPDPHVCANLLKLYIRELPAPVLTFELYADFVEAGGLPDDQAIVSRLKPLLSFLSPLSRTFLSSLVAFLVQVAARSSENKMTPENLAIVFGPGLLRPPPEDITKSLSDSPAVIKVCRALIEHAALLFPHASRPTSNSVHTNSPQQDASPLPTLDTCPRPQQDASDATSPHQTASKSLVRALYDYDGSNSDSPLTFQVGDVIEVLERKESGWWHGSIHGKAGFFPASYVKEVQDVSRPIVPRSQSELVGADRAFVHQGENVAALKAEIRVWKERYEAETAVTRRLEHRVAELEEHTKQMSRKRADAIRALEDALQTLR